MIYQRAGDPVKFFIPFASDDAEAARVYQSIRDHISRVCGADLSPLRVFRPIHWNRGKRIVAEVGKPHAFNEEVVVAILWEEMRKLYHVCTYSRGVSLDGPILVGGGDVDSAELFDTEPTSAGRS